MKYVFLFENFQFLEVKVFIYLNKRVIVVTMKKFPVFGYVEPYFSRNGFLTPV